jgi:hypothetical protein
MLFFSKGQKVCVPLRLLRDNLLKVNKIKSYIKILKSKNVKSLKNLKYIKI